MEFGKDHRPMEIREIVEVVMLAEIMALVGDQQHIKVLRIRLTF